MCEREKLYEEIKNASLFADLDRMQCLFLLEYLCARRILFKKGSMIYAQESATETFALVVRGTVEMARYDCMGNRFLLLTQSSGTCIGLASTLFKEWIPYTHIIARSDCEILFFDAEKLRGPACLLIPACAILKNNISKQLVSKETELLGKLSLINCKTIREKVLVFLAQQAEHHCSDCFEIEFSRQDMADFLSIDRSALSKELANMKRDGLIDYCRNHFELKKGEWQQ